MTAAATTTKATEQRRLIPGNAAGAAAHGNRIRVTRRRGGWTDWVGRAENRQQRGPCPSPKGPAAQAAPVRRTVPCLTRPGGGMLSAGSQLSSAGSNSVANWLSAGSDGSPPATRTRPLARSVAECPNGQAQDTGWLQLLLRGLKSSASLGPPTSPLGGEGLEVLPVLLTGPAGDVADVGSQAGPPVGGCGRRSAVPSPSVGARRGGGQPSGACHRPNSGARRDIPPVTPPRPRQQPPIAAANWLPRYGTAAASQPP